MLKFLCILATLICWFEHGSCQSPCMYPVNLQACLDGIRNVTQDTKRFYFGSSYIAKCTGRSPMDVDCYNNWPGPRNRSIASILFKPGTFDPNTLDRYLNVTFHSPPGSYHACDHTFRHRRSQTITLDPTSNKTHEPWHVRMAPNMTWNYDANVMYTILIKDVGATFIHGLIINIPGNAVGLGDFIDSYHGPMNSRNITNPYAFMLFEQSGHLVLNAFWNQTISNPWRANFSINDFRDQNKLKGPIAMNFLMASYDAYAIENSKMWIQNCAPFVENSFRKLDTPFISNVPKFSVFMRVKFHNTFYDFTYCCNYQVYPERTFFLDPIGNGFRNASETRTGNRVTLHVSMNKMFPNATIDFAGKMYTMLAVDPSIPQMFSAVGTKYNPLVHWIALNGEVDRTGMIKFEREFPEWLGPRPPDDKPHSYIFMLFEQSSGMLYLTDTTTYSMPSCANHTRAGRCLFMVDKFASQNNLKLVSASWFWAENDDFVNMTRGVSQDIVCGGRYPCPAPTMVAGSPSIFGMKNLLLTSGVILVTVLQLF